MSVCDTFPVCRQNCSVAIQWGLAENGQIEADADIVGAGVIISFIVTAHATFVVVVLGYLTFSFEDDCTNKADIKIVGCFRWFLKRLYLVLRQTCGKLLRHTDAVNVGLSDNVIRFDLPERQEHPARKYRIEAFRDFMLALSDQQLVTGLAMLVAGFGHWNEISIYSANVVSALAYFSASVHMGTLDFLMTYLRGHGIVKGCRVFAMVCTLTLLVFLLGMGLSSTWYVDNKRSNLFLICAFWNFAFGWDTYDGLGYVVSRLYIIGILIWLHYERIDTLYSVWGPLPQGEDLMTKKKLERYGIKGFDYREKRYKQRARQIIVVAPNWRRTFATLRLVESFAFHEVFGSRIAQISSLLYANIYGAILIFDLRRAHEGTVGPFNTMGFGQIVPVFLLVLLIFALIESVYGYTDALKEIAVQPSQSLHDGETATANSTSEMDLLASSSSTNLAAPSGGEHNAAEDWLPPGQSGDVESISLQDFENLHTVASDDPNDLDTNNHELESMQQDHESTTQEFESALQDFEGIQQQFQSSHQESESNNEASPGALSQYEQESRPSLEVATTNNDEQPNAESEIANGPNHSVENPVTDEEVIPPRHTDAQQLVLPGIVRAYSSGVKVPNDPGQATYATLIRKARHNQDLRRSYNADLRRGRKDSAFINTDIKEAKVPHDYRSPTRVDTEATLGMRAPSSEHLWNAVQNDPGSLLARVILESPFEVPAIYRTMMMYAILFIVVQSLLACATHQIFGTGPFLVLTFIVGIMQVRHLFELYRRLGRISSIGLRQRRAQQRPNRVTITR